MENSFSTFYREFYLKTNGFIPTAPINRNVYPGDFFQIIRGEMVVLGNIFQKGIISSEDAAFDYGLRLNPASWTFDEGVSKPYSGRGTRQRALEDFEYSTQLLAFEKEGSFFFKGNNPESIRIQNWNDFQDELIIKMTQTLYSFREVYVITDVAVTSDWTLAISSSEKGELEISTNEDNFGLIDIFGHHSSKTVQSKDIEYYHRESNKKPVFYKAQKLVVQDEHLNIFISDLINSHSGHNDWANSYFDFDFHTDQGYPPRIPSNSSACLLDMLQANQLNPNTALLYFRWTDVNQDDIRKLFPGYADN